MQITEAAKKSAANEALRVWHNAALSFPENYQLTFEQLIQWIDKSGDGQGSWRVNFGSSVIITQEYLGIQAVNNAMENLAWLSQGRVTTYPDGFFRGAEFQEALHGKVSTWNWDKIKVISTAIAKDAADAVASGSRLFLGGTMIYVALAGLLFIVVFANSSGKSVSIGK